MTSGEGAGPCRPSGPCYSKGNGNKGPECSTAVQAEDEMEAQTKMLVTEMETKDALKTYVGSNIAST